MNLIHIETDLFVIYSILFLPKNKTKQKQSVQIWISAFLKLYKKYFQMYGFAN